MEAALPFPKPLRAPRRRRRSTGSPLLAEYRALHPRCEVRGCGAIACPEPHHILPRGGARGRIDDAWNLLSLCAFHHARFHAWGWRIWLDRLGQAAAHLRAKVEHARSAA